MSCHVMAVALAVVVVVVSSNSSNCIFFMVYSITLPTIQTIRVSCVGLTNDGLENTSKRLCPISRTILENACSG